MFSLKSLLLRTYFYGTYLPRRWWCARAERQGNAPIVILYYHRVADDAANDWTISNAMFRREVAWLKEHFDLVSLEETQRRMRSGTNHRMAAHISFDDGYADNFTHALPELIQNRVPFSYFVNSTHVLKQIPFPHDVALKRPFAPNTVEQIKFLADAGVEIGSHTRRHVDLGTIHDSTQIFDEIVGCKHDLEAMTGSPVRYFAFPFGMRTNLNLEAFRIVRENGFAGACSAYGGYNFPGEDAFHLHRFCGSASFDQFRNWMLFDPLKELRVRRFDTQLPKEIGNAAPNSAVESTRSGGPS